MDFFSFKRASKNHDSDEGLYLQPLHQNTELGEALPGLALTESTCV